MNEKESHDVTAEDSTNFSEDEQPQPPLQHNTDPLQHSPQQQQQLEHTHLQQQQLLQHQAYLHHHQVEFQSDFRSALLDGRVGGVGPREALAIHSTREAGPEGPKEPGGTRKPGLRSKSGIGPPPRPFKKARYAWEIKNYEHTLSNMAQNLGECSADLPDDTQDSSDVNSEASHEDGLEPREALPPLGLDRPAFLDPRARQLTGPLAPMMPAPYPTTYGMVAPPPDALRPGDVKDADPDAGILRWHTRQLCRSIFDNTVNRMLENMGFSPVTERSQGIHPLLVLSLSDDDEREAEEAQQRLENEALTAAMHHKGLFLPPYHYDPLESGTTTDYDSSDDDSDLGEDPGQDDLAQDPPLHMAQEPPLHMAQEPPFHIAQEPPLHMAQEPPLHMAQEPPLNMAQEPPLHMAHLITRPVARVPAMMPDMAMAPLMATAQMPPPSSTQPSTPSPTPPAQPPESHCDVAKQVCDVGGSVATNGSPLTDANQNTLEAQPEAKQGATQDATQDETHAKHHADADDVKKPDGGKSESENNNDKYFVDQAIEMAIKQQGLGYQQA